MKNVLKAVALALIIASSAMVTPASGADKNGCDSGVVVYFGVESNPVEGQPSKLNTNITQCNLVWAGGTHAGRGYGSEVFVIPPGATHMSASKFTYADDVEGPFNGRGWNWSYSGAVNRNSATPAIEAVTTSATGTVSGRVNSLTSPIPPTVTGNLTVRFQAGLTYEQVVGSVTEPYIWCGNVEEIVTEVTLACNPAAI